jgi:serine/threonine-protein kinase
VEVGPGTVIDGRYVIEGRLGSGGVGQVWAGRSTADGTRVAIKTLLPAASAHRELVARFRREAKFLSRIKSQYVARVLDFLLDKEHGLVLVLELVEGKALSEELKHGELSVEQGIDVAWDVLGGVADLHREQIVHRDLKPGNVILRRSPSGHVHAVIVDFGMSRFSGLDQDGEEITALTRADIAVGTIEYMAPEQILNSRGVTTAADIYAVGAMLYRAVTGEHVFPGIEDRAVFARHKMITDPTPLSTGRSDPVALGFEAIVNRMLRRMPADRYQRAEEAIADLAALRAGGARASAFPARPEPRAELASVPPPPGMARGAPDSEPPTPLVALPSTPGSSAPSHPQAPGESLASVPPPMVSSAPPHPHAPGESLASVPPPMVSSAPAHPITLCAPASPPDAEARSGGRAGSVALAVGLVVAAAAGLGLTLQRRARVEEEPRGISAIDEPSIVSIASARSAGSDPSQASAVAPRAAPLDMAPVLADVTPPPASATRPQPAPPATSVARVNQEPPKTREPRPSASVARPASGERSGPSKPAAASPKPASSASPTPSAKPKPEATAAEAPAPAPAEAPPAPLETVE